MLVGVLGTACGSTTASSSVNTPGPSKSKAIVTPVTAGPTAEVTAGVSQAGTTAAAAPPAATPATIVTRSAIFTVPTIT